MIEAKSFFEGFFRRLINIGNSIGFKINICISILLIAAMSTTGILYFIQSSQSLESEIKANLQSTVKNNANLIEEKLKNLKWQVFNTANDVKMKTMDWETQKVCLMDDIGRLDFQNMAVCNLDGKANFINNMTEDISDMDFFKFAKQGNEVISNPIISKSEKNEKMLYICSPITDSNNQVRQILIGTLNIDVLSRYISGMKAGNSGNAMIIDSAGTIIASNKNYDSSHNINTSAKMTSYESHTQTTKLKRETLTGLSGLKTYYINGTGNWLAYASISGTSWLLGVTVPYNEVTGPLDSLKITIFILTLIFLIFSIATVMILCRILITLPIKNTLHLIKEMNMGHLNSKLKIKSKDEIGRMAHALNEFADYISNVIDSMKKISIGELNSHLKSRDENDIIAPSVNGTISAVKKLVRDSKMLLSSAKNGNFDVRADENAHNGDFREIISGFNNTLTKITESFYFYESIIDSIKLPIFVSDLNKNCLFENKAMEMLTGICRKEAKGKPCFYCENMPCSTGKCAVEYFQSGNSIATYETKGRHYKVKTSQLKDLYGNHKGFVEIIEDVTASAEKEKYLKTEVANLAHKLQMVSQGSFDFDFDVMPGNKYTIEENQLFTQINSNLKKARDSIMSILMELSRVNSEILDGNLSARTNDCEQQGFYKSICGGLNNVFEILTGYIKTNSEYISLISKGSIPPVIAGEYKGDFKAIQDSTNDLISTMNNLLKETSALITAVRLGKLSTRADTSKFKGEWKSLVSGVNDMLTHFSAPVTEISKVMSNISHGDLDTEITNSFEGDFAVFAAAVNQMRENLRNIISDISDVLGNIADGNLNLPAVREYEGGFAHISDSLNKIIDSLNALLNDLQNSAKNVEKSASQMLASSTSLSKSTVEQFSTIEMLAESVIYISDKVQDNAENTQKMNNVAIEAKSHALSGKELMCSLLDSMNVINDSSSNVGHIIKAIDGISIQTNLLALNATIEAAHAGAYGKSFAVVAEEVGRLAKNSASSAKESEYILKNSIRSIEESTIKAGNTARKLEEIVTGVETMVRLVEHVNAVFKDQTKSLDSIDEQISIVSNIVQQTKVMAEDNTKISMKLKSEADNLHNLACNFILRTENQENYA